MIKYLRAVKLKERLIIPITYRQAIKSKQSKHWIKAMNDEIRNMSENKVFQLVPNTAQRLIPTKFVFSYKDNQYKARLVARGDLQLADSYANTYAPTMAHSSLRLLLSIALHFDLLVWNVDVRRAFLNADLKEEVFIKIPEGVNIDPKLTVIKLLKALYGLRQAGHEWYSEITRYLQSIGFELVFREKTIFVHKHIKWLFVGIYVDDILIACRTIEIKDYLIKQLQRKYELHDLGEVSNTLGIRVQRSENCFTYDVSEQIMNLCEIYNVVPNYKVKVPLPANEIVYPHANGMPCDADAYTSLIGSIMYIARVARADVLFAITQLSQFREVPKNVHYRKLIRVLTFLRNTFDKKMRLVKDELILNVYSDANFATNFDYRSFRGTVVMLGRNAINWIAKKQDGTAQSTDESEIIAANYSLRELMYFKQLICELLHSYKPNLDLDEKCILCDESKPKLLIDNQSTIVFAKNGFGKRTKYISTKFIYLHEQLSNYSVLYVPSKENTADLFTKNLPSDLFYKHSDSIFQS